VINGHQFTAKHRLPLIIHLLLQGYEIKCVVPKESEAHIELIKNNIQTINWNISRKGTNPLLELLSIFRLFKIYKKESPIAIIHATIKPVLYGSIVSKITKSSQIINLVTGLGSMYVSKGWFNKIKRNIISAIYKLFFSFIPQTVIFQNESDKNYLINNHRFKLLNEVVISGSGVKIKDFPLCKFPVQKNVTFIGRIIKEKGIFTFINAAKIIKEKRKDICFSLVGPLDAGNPSFINKKTIKMWESEKIIEWWENVDDIFDVYKNSSIIVLPSYREGLPKTLLEAGLTGRPVIASDVPGCRDVVLHGKTGYLFPLNDSETFSSYILDLIDNEEKMKKLGLAGRNHVIKHFSTDLIIPQIINEIEKSISRKIVYR
tara:strand:+ start:930 stop:2051 length:1122 start_codon:yes stop_codon:yes gene_type:complete